MEKSATTKGLKKRILCIALSLLFAFCFTANEAFGFEFPPDADEPILNETEIALSEKVMNLELAVRTMKTKKKNIKVVVQPSAELEELIDEAEAEGYEIYYKFCRSVRKHSRYITWRTHEKNVYVNKEGVRGKLYPLSRTFLKMGVPIFWTRPLNAILDFGLALTSYSSKWTQPFCWTLFHGHECFCDIRFDF